MTSVLHIPPTSCLLSLDRRARYGDEYRKVANRKVDDEGWVVSSSVDYTVAVQPLQNARRGVLRRLLQRLSSVRILRCMFFSCYSSSSLVGKSLFHDLFVSNLWRHFFLLWPSERFLQSREYKKGRNGRIWNRMKQRDQNCWTIFYLERTRHL